VMGCYGIGLGRVLGTVVECLSDDKGLVWPTAIAPFQVHLVELSGGDEKVAEYAKALYAELNMRSVETLWDDRDFRAGEKFAESDLIGIPLRIVVSKKTLEEGKLEVKNRLTGEVSMVTREELFETLTSKF
jgi:prolyl-tRNA synthetase